MVLKERLADLMNSFIGNAWQVRCFTDMGWILRVRVGLSTRNKIMLCWPTGGPHNYCAMTDRRGQNRQGCPGTLGAVKARTQ